VFNSAKYSSKVLLPPNPSEVISILKKKKGQADEREILGSLLENVQKELCVFANLVVFPFLARLQLLEKGKHFALDQDGEVLVRREHDKILNIL
jgi:hypothetical protein